MRPTETEARLQIRVQAACARGRQRRDRRDADQDRSIECESRAEESAERWSRALTLYIKFATALVISDRLTEWERRMPIVELKGLGSNVEAAMSAIRKAKAASSRMHSSVGMLAATALDIAEQCDEHTKNLLREASSMGNSNGGEALDEQPSPPKKPAAQSVNGETVEFQTIATTADVLPVVTIEAPEAPPGRALEPGVFLGPGHKGG